MLTFVKVRDGSFALLCVLLFCILFVSIVSLYMVPRIELEDIILLIEIARAKLKRIASLEVVLRVVGPVRWDCLRRIRRCGRVLDCQCRETLDYNSVTVTWTRLHGLILIRIRGCRVEASRLLRCKKFVKRTRRKIEVVGGDLERR